MLLSWGDRALRFTHGVASHTQSLNMQYRVVELGRSRFTGYSWRCISHTISGQLYNRGKIEAIPFY
ncbi:hypothetical protein [Tolypothrix sp. VBCCA 56010]|uniref:hypothetical protein n=1 Tax=Tolypothrix sp. VBCCA 56010 TaxID=3137731 RepID=UPI003D7E2E26